MWPGHEHQRRCWAATPTAVLLLGPADHLEEACHSLPHTGTVRGGCTHHSPVGTPECTCTQGATAQQQQPLLAFKRSAMTSA
jgi:hypothetical protein